MLIKGCRIAESLDVETSRVLELKFMALRKIAKLRKWLLQQRRILRGGGGGGIARQVFIISITLVQ